jgi:carbon monoxide dehydrogenase subunit G
MQLAGKHVVNAASSTVWTMLMDIDSLSKLVPGLSRLEKTGDHTSKSIFEIKLGPVSSSFSGNLQLENIEEQKGFDLKIQQNSKIGNANAIINIAVLPVAGAQTEVSFNGDVKLSGILASMGNRVIGSVSNTLTKQFFTNLEKEIEKNSAKTSLT